MSVKLISKAKLKRRYRPPSAPLVQYLYSKRRKCFISALWNQHWSLSLTNASYYSFQLYHSSHWMLQLLRFIPLTFWTSLEARVSISIPRHCMAWGYAQCVQNQGSREGAGVTHRQVRNKADSWQVWFLINFWSLHIQKPFTIAKLFSTSYEVTTHVLL